MGTSGPTGGSRRHRGATNRGPVSNIPCCERPASCSRWVLSIVSTHALGGTEPRTPETSWTRSARGRRSGSFSSSSPRPGCSSGSSSRVTRCCSPAGILASQGNLNIACDRIGCFLAAVIGDQVGYTIGNRAGPPLFRRPDSRLFKQGTSIAPRSSSTNTGRRPSFSPASCRSCARSRRCSRAWARWTAARSLTYNVVGGFVWAVGVTVAGYILGVRHRQRHRQVPPADHRRHHRALDPSAPDRDAAGAPPHPRCSGGVRRRRRSQGRRAPRGRHRGLATPEGRLLLPARSGSPSRAR